MALRWDSFMGFIGYFRLLRIGGLPFRVTVSDGARRMGRFIRAGIRKAQNDICLSFDPLRSEQLFRFSSRAHS